jgi:virulence factor Mce-like protein
VRAQLGGRIMISRRLVINLITLFFVAFALVAYGVVDLLGDPLRSPTAISANFPDASGLYPDFTVDLNGVPVGTVGSVSLTKTGTRVDMNIEPGVNVPNDVLASIDIANDLGEQVVELTPSHGGAVPSLKSGATVPVSRTGIPVNLGQVVASATKLLQAIPAGDLNSLLGDLSTALSGQAQNLRTIISASSTFSEEFLAYQDQFKELLANAPPVLNAVAAVGPQLQQALVNTEALVQVLATQRYTLQNLLSQGSIATGQLGNLVETQAPNLGCLLHDLADVNQNVGEPANLMNLAVALNDNQLFFGAVRSLAVQGTAVPLVAGAAPDPNQLFLRVRLLLPPEPTALAYDTATPIPDIYPGAACNTEFGAGVPAANQAGFQPAAGGTVVTPTAAESQVEGGASNGQPLVSADRSSYRAHASNPVFTLLPLGLILPAFFLAWSARPWRRKLRRHG